jgi:hypothetical protein
MGRHDAEEKILKSRREHSQDAQNTTLRCLFGRRAAPNHPFESHGETKTIISLINPRFSDG